MFPASSFRDLFFKLQKIKNFKNPFNFLTRLELFRNINYSFSQRTLRNFIKTNLN